MISHTQLFSQTAVLAVVTTPGLSSIRDMSFAFAFVGLGYRALVCMVYGPTYAAVVTDSSGAMLLHLDHHPSEMCLLPLPLPKWVLAST